MNSGESGEATASTEGVKEIVSKIKSQGTFDQFRKECLADVDTKPAYQNLRQRVESYVARFLSTQKWSSKLNKNQLRNNLRKQINQSGMLNQGVERIIDQVVNPKIFQLIKPKIDDAVCSFMGIELKTYQEQLQRRKQKQQNRQQVAQQNLQPLMSIHTSTSPEYNNMMMGGYGAMYQTGGMWPNPGAPFLTAPNANYPMPMSGPAPFSVPQFEYGWTPGYTDPAMFGQASSMPAMIGQQVATPVSSASTTGSSSFFPHPTNIPPPNLSIPPPTVVASASGSTTPPPPGTVELTPHPGFSTPVKPSSTPPPPAYSPSTVSSPGALSLLANVSSYASSLDTSADGTTDTVAAQPPQPPPPPPPETAEATTEISTEDSDVNDMTQSFESKAGFADFTIPASSQGVTLELAADTVVGGGDENRPHFRFAWDRIATVQEDAVSDVTISSVHTSDLSSFEEDDDDDKSDADVNRVQVAGEDAAMKVDTLEDATAADSDSDSITSPEVTPISSPIRPEDLPEVNLDRPCEVTARSRTPTPKKETDANDTNVSTPTTPEPSKTKKLLSYSYKYSSDEEESREEKKVRIAKEKEERYQKRLQRRAELEAKKKEREEEKVRMREEKKRRSAEKKQESETTDDGADVKKEDLNSSVFSTSLTSQDDSEGGRGRRKRKTKEEMKQQLKQQKVMERRLCRQRTRNKRYASGEFETMFSPRRQPFSSQSYVAAEHVIEESVVEVEDTVVVYSYLDDNNTGAVETVPKSPPTPTLDENPSTPTQDERSLTPTLDEKQPPTPTMDEQPYVVELSEIPLPEQPIPIVKVAAESVVHNTRSRAKLPVDESAGSSLVVSPSSDKSEVVVRDGKKKRKQSGNSPDDHDTVRRSPRVVSPTGLTASRSKKDLTSTKSPDQTELKTKASKRYSEEDLYKPRISHRSPPVSKDPHTPPTGLRSGKQLSSPFTGDSSVAMKEEPNFTSSVAGRKKQSIDIKEEIKEEPLDTQRSSNKPELPGSHKVDLGLQAPVKEEKIIVEVVVSDTESSMSKASSRRRSMSQSRSYRSESSGSVRHYHQRSRHRSRSRSSQSRSSRHRSRSRSYSKHRSRSRSYSKHKSRSRSRSRKHRCSVSSSDNGGRRKTKRSKSKRSHRRHRSDSRGSRSSSGSRSRGRKYHSRKRKPSTSSSESLDEFGRVKPKDRPSSLTWAESVSSSSSSSVDSVDEAGYRPSRHDRRRTATVVDSSPEGGGHAYRHPPRGHPRTQSASSNDSLAMKKGAIAMEPISSDSELYSDFEDHKSAGDGYAGTFPDGAAGYDYQAMRDARDKTPIDQVSFGEAEKRFKPRIDRVDFGLAERHSRKLSGYEKPRVPTFQQRRGQMGQNYYPMPPTAPFPPPVHFKRNPDWQPPWTGSKPSPYPPEEWGTGGATTRPASGVVRDDIQWSLSGRDTSESPLKKIPSPDAGYRKTPLKRHLSSERSGSPSPDRSKHSQTSAGSRNLSPHSALSRNMASPPQVKKGVFGASISERRASNDSKGSLSSGEIVDNSSDDQEARPVPMPLSSLELEPVSPDTPPELRGSRSPTPVSPRRRLSTSSVSESGSLSSSPRSRRYSTSSPSRKSRRLSPGTRSDSPSRKHAHSSFSDERSKQKRSISSHSQKQYPSQYASPYSLSRRSPVRSSASSQQSPVSYSQRYSSSKDVSALSLQKESTPSSDRAGESAPEVLFDSSLYSPIHDTDSLPGSPLAPLSAVHDLEEVSDTESLDIGPETEEEEIKTENDDQIQTEESRSVQDDVTVVKMHAIHTSPSSKQSEELEDKDASLGTSSACSPNHPSVGYSTVEVSAELSLGATTVADLEAGEVSDHEISEEGELEKSDPDTKSEAADELKELSQQLSMTVEDLHRKSDDEECSHSDEKIESSYPLDKESSGVTLQEEIAKDEEPTSKDISLHNEFDSAKETDVHSPNYCEEITDKLSEKEISQSPSQPPPEVSEEHSDHQVVNMAEEQSDHQVVNLSEEQSDHQVVNMAEEQSDHQVVNMAEEQSDHQVVNMAEEHSDHQVVNMTEEHSDHQVVNLAEEQSDHQVVNLAEEQSDHQVVNLAEGQSDHQVVNMAEEHSDPQVVNMAEEHPLSTMHIDEITEEDHSPTVKETKVLVVPEEIPSCSPPKVESMALPSTDHTSTKVCNYSTVEKNTNSKDVSSAMCFEKTNKSALSNKISEEKLRVLSSEDIEQSVTEETSSVPLLVDNEKSLDVSTVEGSEILRETSGCSNEESETIAVELYEDNSVSHSSEQIKLTRESESLSCPSLSSSEQDHPLSTNNSSPTKTLVTDAKEEKTEESSPKGPVKERNPLDVTQESSEVLPTMPSSSLQLLQQHTPEVLPTMPSSPLQLLQQHTPEVLPTMPSSPLQLLQQHTPEVLPTMPSSPLQLSQQHTPEVLPTMPSSPLQLSQQHTPEVLPTMPSSPLQLLQQHTPEVLPTMPSSPLQLLQQHTPEVLPTMPSSSLQLLQHTTEILPTMPSSPLQLLQQHALSDSSPPHILSSLFSSNQPDTPSPPCLRRQDPLEPDSSRVHRRPHQSPGHSSVESGSDQSPPSLSPAAAGRWRRSSGPAVSREVTTTTEDDTDANSQVSSSSSRDTRQGRVVRRSRSSRRSSTSDIDAVSSQSSATETAGGGGDSLPSKDLGRGKRHRKSPDRLSPSRQQTSPHLVKERKGSAGSGGRESRKQKQTASTPASPRETRSTRSAAATPVRETRSRREKSPPAKRAKR